MAILTATGLRGVLNYNPETGAFARTQGMKAGIEWNGSIQGHGYLLICVDGIQYHAHRLAWLWVTGCWPSEEIDHINHIKTDNRFSNLREVSRSLNQQNRRKALSTNRVGLLGVGKTKYNKFHARIDVKGKSKFLGCFDTPEEAHHAYIAAKRQLHEGNTL